MLKNRVTFIGLATLFAASAFAGEQGFIYQGKAYVVYKDGEKVGKTLAEMFPQAAAQDNKRKPANVAPSGNAGWVADTIGYQDHDGVRCFYHPQSSIDGALSCVRLKK